RKKHADNTRYLIARQHSEQYQQRIELHTFAHQVRRQHVILKQPIERPKNNVQEDVTVTAQAGDQYYNDGARSRTYDGYKLPQGGEPRQQNRIGSAGHREEDALRSK